jgi:hypothetical protein
VALAGGEDHLPRGTAKLRGGAIAQAPGPARRHRDGFAPTARTSSSPTARRSHRPDDWQRDLLDARKRSGSALAPRPRQRVTRAGWPAVSPFRPAWPSMARSWSMPRPGGTGWSGSRRPAGGPRCSCRPARLSRPPVAGRRRQGRRRLGGGLRTAQPARRVRAARAGLPPAHGGRGGPPLLGGAQAARRPQLLRAPAGRRREAPGPAEALGADPLGRTLPAARRALPAALQPAQPRRWRHATA